MNLQLDHFSDDYTTNQKPREGLKRLSALFSSVLRAVWLSFVVTLISSLLGSCVCGRSFSVCAPRSGPPTVQRVLQQACCLERKFMDALRAIFSVSRGGGDSASGTRTEVPKLALAFKRSCLLWISRCGCWAADTTKQSRDRSTTHSNNSRENVVTRKESSPVRKNSCGSKVGGHQTACLALAHKTQKPKPATQLRLLMAHTTCRDG